MWACRTIWQTTTTRCWSSGAWWSLLKTQKHIARILINSRGWYNIWFYVSYSLDFFLTAKRSAFDCAVHLTSTPVLLSFRWRRSLFEVSLSIDPDFPPRLFPVRCRRPFFQYFSTTSWEWRFKFTVQWISLGFNSLFLLLEVFLLLSASFPSRMLTSPAQLCFSGRIISIFSRLLFPGVSFTVFFSLQPFGRNQLKFQQQWKVR